MAKFSHRGLRAGIEMLLVNGRLSERSVVRYKKIQKLIRPQFKSLAAMAVISERDRKRYVQLGAAPKKIIASGNIKYDLHGQTSPDQADADSKRN